MQLPRSVDCLVVGAGPAGLTAALYLRRFHRSVLLADHGRSRALKIDRSHNYPGFPDGIPGHVLLARLRRQLAGVDGGVTEAEVTRIERRPDGSFAAWLGERALKARTVLLATGVVDAVPPLDGIDTVQRAGLLRHCPICDGHEYRGQRIGVLGLGAHAEREARFIAHYSPHVAVVPLAPVRGRVPPGLARLRSPAVGVELPPDGGVRVHLRDGSAREFDVLYAAIGVRPRTELARGLGARLDGHGNLEVDAHCRTSVPGLYAAGDVVSALDQIVVATGHGALAATDIHNSLPTRHHPARGAAEPQREAAVPGAALLRTFFTAS